MKINDDIMDYEREREGNVNDKDKEMTKKDNVNDNGRQC